MGNWVGGLPGKPSWAGLPFRIGHSPSLPSCICPGSTGVSLIRAAASASADLAQPTEVHSWLLCERGHSPPLPSGIGHLPYLPSDIGHSPQPRRA